MENPISNNSTQQGCADETQRMAAEQTKSSAGSAPSVSNEDDTVFTASDKLRIIHVLSEITFGGIIIFLGSQAYNYWAGHNLVKSLEDVGSVTGFFSALGLSEDLRNVDAAIDVFKALYRDGIIFCVVGLLLSGIVARLSRQKGDID